MENAKNIPILIYVTKAKPYLSKDAVAGGRYVLSDAKDYFNRGDLNGLVCFECECKEVFEAAWNAGHYWVLGCSLFSKKSLLDHACVSKQELVDYGRGGKLYAYRFENVRAIGPFPITQLYRDEACTIRLARAPQSHCFAYRKIYVHLFIDGNRELSVNELAHVYQDNVGLFNKEKVLVFSIRSPFVALEANVDPETGEPFKDLELRKARISGAGIEYR